MGFVLLILWIMAEIVQTEQEAQFLGYKLCEMSPQPLLWSPSSVQASVPSVPPTLLISEQGLSSSLKWARNTISSSSVEKKKRYND